MEREYTTAEKVGIIVAVLLGIPVLLMILLIVWQIFIDLGFDVAHR